MDYEKIFYADSNTDREVEWAYYKRGTAGSFATALCRAWELGDLENQRRLELAFPHLFHAAKAWMYSDNPDEFIEELLKGAN